jgi:hypothetical protein
MDEPAKKKLLKGEFLMSKNTYRLDIQVDAEDSSFSIPLLEWYALHQAPYTEGRRILWLIEQCRKNEENAGKWLLLSEPFREVVEATQDGIETFAEELPFIVKRIKDELRRREDVRHAR